MYIHNAHIHDWKRHATVGICNNLPYFDSMRYDQVLVLSNIMANKKLPMLRDQGNSQCSSMSQFEPRYKNLKWS